MAIPRSTALAVTAALAVLLTAAGHARQAEPGVQLRAAIQKEDVAGDLEGAMALYRQVIAANGRNRAVTAKALLRLGGCLEKLGQQEARKVYERLIGEYPDQATEVAAARQQLARMGSLAKSAGSEKPTFRKIHVPTGLSLTGSGKLSPDGQTLAFIQGGSLWILPVHGRSDPDISGGPARLTEPVHAWDNANVSIAWSGNGKWIAFRVAVPQADKNAEEELYVVPATGGAPKRLPVSWKRWADDVYTLRYALSDDAETLYFAAGATHDALRIYSMPVAGGEWHPLTEPTSRQPALSPDGSRIAYVKMQDEGLPGTYGTKEIWIGPASGGAGRRIHLQAGETWVQSPVWSPDGSMLAFLGSEHGNMHRQLCVLPLPDGDRPIGEVTRFDLPGWTSDVLAGWTKDNRLGILIPVEQQTRLYTLPAGGGKAVQITRADSWLPNWTPDGKTIYFDGVHGGERAAIETIPAAGGEVTRIPIDKAFEFLQPSYPVAGISVSPDGTLCFAGFYRRKVTPDGETPASAIYLLPAKGGRPLRLTRNEEGDYQPTWSRDGSEIAFIRREHSAAGQVVANIFVIPREGGEPRRITAADDKVQLAAIDWSPDGRHIAFFGRDDTVNPCLRVTSPRGGPSRVVVPGVSSPGLYWAGLSWSPDGKSLAYVSEGVLWVVPADGGKPTKVETGLDSARMGKIDWSPDGRTIVFEATRGGEHELWLMENFIDLVKRAR